MTSADDVPSSVDAVDDTDPGVGENVPPVTWVVKTSA